MTELPLRIIDQPGGAVIRCMCGKELASIRRALASDQAYLKVNVARPLLSPDITAAGLAVMVAHAMGCQRARVALEYQSNGRLSELTASYLPRSR